MGNLNISVVLWNRFKGMPLCYEPLLLIATESHDWSGGLGLMYFLPWARIPAEMELTCGFVCRDICEALGESKVLTKKLMVTREPT